MSRRSLTEYRCDGCEHVVVADQVPSGWMGARRKGEYGYRATGIFLLFGAGASGKTRRRDIPDDSWWCSPACFKRWLLAQWESANREDAQ